MAPRGKGQKEWSKSRNRKLIGLSTLIPISTIAKICPLRTRLAGDFKVVWFDDFKNATVTANTQHAARWLGRHQGRCGLEIWKLNLPGDKVDELIEDAGASALTVEAVDLESLRESLRERLAK